MMVVGNDLFNDNFLSNDSSSLANFSLDDTALNGYLHSQSRPHRRSRPQSFSFTGSSLSNPIAETFPDPLLRLNDTKTLDNSLFKLDNQNPWTPLSIGERIIPSNVSVGHPTRKPRVTSGCARSSNPRLSQQQQYHTSQLTPSMARPRSDSGYETLDKKSQSLFSWGTGDSDQAFGNINGRQDEIDISPMDIGFNPDQPTFYDSPDFYRGRFAPESEVKGASDDLDAPENPPFICELCEKDPKLTKKPDLKNKSDWK